MGQFVGVAHVDLQGVGLALGAQAGDADADAGPFIGVADFERSRAGEDLQAVEAKKFVGVRQAQGEAARSEYRGFQLFLTPGLDDICQGGDVPAPMLQRQSIF